MSNDRIQTVIVLGGGSAGALSALTFKLLMPDMQVTMIRSADIPAIGVGEATTASIPAFLHNDLQLDRRDFYEAVRPSWKLGIRFLWGHSDTAEFFYPFRSGMECPDIFVRSNAHYGLADYARASLYSLLMTGHRSPCLTTVDGQHHLDENFGYHFDSQRLNSYLEGICERMGVTLLDREVVGVTHHDNGSIQSLRLNDDVDIVGDLFVDCSGFRSQLLGEALAEPFCPFRKSLFCDMAVVGSWQRNEPVLPYTTAETMDHGWCWRIDLPDRISRGYVFSSQFCDAEQAAAEMRAKNPLLEDELRTVRFRSGRYERFWVRNVAAIGNSAGFVEPLESTGLHMVMESITALCRALIDTDRRIVPEMQVVANRFVAEMWDDIRDFLAIHFAFNRHCDSPFWRHCQSETELAGGQRIAEFYRRVGPSQIAHTCLPRQSVFGVRGYLELLVGQRVETDFQFQPTVDEQQAWNDHLQQVQTVGGVGAADGRRVESRR